MKAFLIRGGMRLVPESSMESDELESWFGKDLEFQECHHPFPSPGSFAFDHGGRCVVTGSVFIRDRKADEVPLCSVDQRPDDPRYASMEIHTLPLEASKLEFLRVDGFWFVKVSEGAQEAIESAWRARMAPVSCEHRGLTIDNFGNANCDACGCAMEFDRKSRNFVPLDRGGSQ